jgi:hypothetical protein
MKLCPKASLLLVLSALPVACGPHGSPVSEPRTTGSQLAQSPVVQRVAGKETGPPADANPARDRHTQRAGAGDRSLTAPLPRGVVYEGLRFTVTRGTISDMGPAGKKGTAGAQAYAHLDVTIHNELNATTVYGVSSGLVNLELGDGRVASPVSDWTLELKPRATQEAELVYTVPATATWQRARLTICERDKEPAVLTLDGSASGPQYPVRLAVPEKAEARDGEVDYKVLSAALDVEYEPHGQPQRVPAGKRCLKLSLRVTYNGRQLSYGFFGESRVRLHAGDETLAPANNVAENLAPKSPQQLSFVFLVPASLSRAELQLGAPKDQGAQVVQISLAPRPARP